MVFIKVFCGNGCLSVLTVSGTFHAEPRIRYNVPALNVDLLFLLLSCNNPSSPNCVSLSASVLVPLCPLRWRLERRNLGRNISAERDNGDSTKSRHQSTEDLWLIYIHVDGSYPENGHRSHFRSGICTHCGVFTLE